MYSVPIRPSSGSYSSFAPKSEAAPATHVDGRQRAAEDPGARGTLPLTLGFRPLLPFEPWNDPPQRNIVRRHPKRHKKTVTMKKRYAQTTLIPRSFNLASTWSNPAETPKPSRCDHAASFAAERGSTALLASITILPSVHEMAVSPISSMLWK